MTPVTGVQQILEQTDPEMAKSQLVFPEQGQCRELLADPIAAGKPRGARPVQRAWSEA